MDNQTISISMWLQGSQNQLMANSISVNPNLTIKQPVADSPLNLTNFQAASASAGVIGNLFETPYAANGLNGSMPMLSGLGNLFSGSSMMPSMPTANMTGIGMPPLEMIPFIFGMAGATGAIDPTTMMAGMAASTTGGMSGMGMPGMGMDMTSMMMGLYGMPGMTGAVASQGTDANIAALMRKMPVVSAGKVEEISTKTVDIGKAWGTQNQNVSLMTADGSGNTLLNSALPETKDKSEFIQSLSTNIDKEVRLAQRGASKEVVAEVLANELLALIEKKDPNIFRTKGFKEKTLTGIKNICLGNIYKNDNDKNDKNRKIGIAIGMNGQQGLADGVEEALQVLPTISNKDNNPHGNWRGGYYNYGWNMATDSPTIKLLQQTTNDLTATAHDNLIQRNSLADAPSASATLNPLAGTAPSYAQNTTQGQQTLTDEEKQSLQMALFSMMMSSSSINPGAGMMGANPMMNMMNPLGAMGGNAGMGQPQGLFDPMGAMGGNNMAQGQSRGMFDPMGVMGGNNNNVNDEEDFLLDNSADAEEGEAVEGEEGSEEIEE